MFLELISEEYKTRSFLLCSRCCNSFYSSLSVEVPPLSWVFSWSVIFIPEGQACTLGRSTFRSGFLQLYALCACLASENFY